MLSIGNHLFRNSAGTDFISRPRKSLICPYNPNGNPQGKAKCDGFGNEFNQVAKTQEPHDNSMSPPWAWQQSDPPCHTGRWCHRWWQRMLQSVHQSEPDYLPKRNKKPATTAVKTLFGIDTRGNGKGNRQGRAMIATMTPAIRSWWTGLRIIPDGGEKFGCDIF